MDYMKPFGCNCQNRVSPATCPQASDDCVKPRLETPCRDNMEPTCRDNMKPYRHMHKSEGCGCDKYETEDMLSGMPLAMAYVPWQEWQNVYDACAGLKKGTIFGELIYPFLYASPVCRDCGCNNGRRM